MRRPLLLRKGERERVSNRGNYDMYKEHYHNHLLESCLYKYIAPSPAQVAYQGESTLRTKGSDFLESPSSVAHIIIVVPTLVTCEIWSVFFSLSICLAPVYSPFHGMLSHRVTLPLCVMGMCCVIMHARGGNCFFWHNTCKMLLLYEFLNTSPLLSPLSLPPSLL